ncbi:Tad domain-containing protein [Domibacillus indicus]|uniref:pilus assembly protein TadG-related protein n=1 Tax=Domibacillus indicus TaxID=1437523 RepID=UPI00203B5A49|nr:pilus assembly protein TadG-related protein [Domibacillus indicus]MCM3790386.1 Tad domain-containing protein [Domibacillus indicus]
MKNFLKKEEGNVIVLLAFGLAVMISMLGLVIDGGHLFVTKSHLQKAANAAALSGAQEIPNDEAAVQEVINRILVSHNETTSLVQSSIKNSSELHVVLEKNVPVFFSSLFGVENVPIKVEAKAALKPLGEAKGVVPLGIEESVNLQYGQTYQLKVDSGDSTSGNFGVLALEGPGAKLYRENLLYGFDQPLKVGDILNTQTGNIAGATREAVNYRANGCQQPPGEYDQRDCSRLMLVVVFKDISTGTQRKSVKITGFAYFYLTDQMGSTDDSIKGIFIKRAGAGTAETAAPLDRGAYAIKLTE